MEGDGPGLGRRAGLVLGMRGWDWGIKDLGGMRELEVEEIDIVNGNEVGVWALFGVTKGL